MWIWNLGEPVRKNVMQWGRCYECGEIVYIDQILVDGMWENVQEPHIENGHLYCPECIKECEMPKVELLGLAVSVIEHQVWEGNIDMYTEIIDDPTLPLKVRDARIRTLDEIVAILEKVNDLKYFQ